ncbi:MAG: hypothetical protein HRF50_14790 [Phycisphaerae bacterium]|jgi:hypothetical protein
MSVKLSVWRRAARLAAMGLPLLLLPAGCEPLSADALLEFTLDFARSALAAWLL